MFIPEFWCGVCACILAEIALIAVAAVVCALQPNNNDKENKS